MAHDSKKGFLSSLFGKKKLTEQDEIEQLESKHRLEERIRQVLAERAVVPELLAREESHAAQVIQEEEVEAPVELLPISASALASRKAPVQPAFVLSAFDTPRSYAANGR